MLTNLDIFRAPKERETGPVKGKRVHTRETVYVRFNGVRVNGVRRTVPDINAAIYTHV